jgi:hypothetical protein
MRKVKRLHKAGRMEECDSFINVFIGQNIYYGELSLYGIFHETPFDVTSAYHDG